jgi:hypothetical protein
VTEPAWEDPRRSLARFGTRTRIGWTFQVGDMKCAACRRADIALDMRTGVCLDCSPIPVGVFPAWS